MESRDHPGKWVVQSGLILMMVAVVVHKAVQRLRSAPITAFAEGKLTFAALTVENSLTIIGGTDEIKLVALDAA